MAISASLGEAVIVTSEMVLTEFANHFADRGSQFRETATRVIDEIRGNPNARLSPQTSLQFQSAVAHYRTFLDKQWSLTDCASILIMQEQDIHEALTHDHHFIQASFRALLRE
ncbi:MAG: type II toxin-antitoxin system VapC family toxin [Pyrinomonadaceae bacterium]